MGPRIAEYWPWITGMAILTLGLTFGSAFRDNIHPGVTSSLTTDDPSIGTRISLPATDVHGRPISSSEQTLLILAGSCSGCSLGAVYPARLRYAPYNQVLIIYLASSNQVKKEFQKPSDKVYLIADPERHWVTTLRAYSAPRFYIVQGGELSAIWKETDKWPYLWTGEDSQ